MKVIVKWWEKKLFILYGFDLIFAKMDILNMRTRMSVVSEGNEVMRFRLIIYSGICVS